MRIFTANYVNKCVVNGAFRPGWIGA